jgi:hypothetical protein
MIFCRPPLLRDLYEESEILSTISVLLICLPYKKSAMTIRSDIAQASLGSIARYLSGAGVALWALVMALAPDVGIDAPWAWMAVFWILQIGVGLMVLQLVLYFLSRTNKTFRWPLWLLVIVSGLLGSFVLAPLYWLIGEGLMLQTLGFAATNDDDLDATLGFGLSAVLHEFVDIVAPVTAAWLVVSWPRLQGLIPPLVVQHSVSDTENTKEPLTAGEPAAARSWRTTIPRELGDDLIAVKSELQYLRVFTARGSALILGALQEIDDAEGQTGLRVHRSWWVHAQHIHAIRKKGDAAVCVLSDGREVPVSRRRKADVLAALAPTANP